MACSPPCFRALARCLLLAFDVASFGDSFGTGDAAVVLAVMEGIVWDLAIVSPIAFERDKGGSVTSPKRWQMRQSILTVLFSPPTGLRRRFFALSVEVGLSGAVFEVMLVRDVHPGTRIVPHPSQDPPDLPLREDFGSLATSRLRCSIRCADVAGAVNE